MIFKRNKKLLFFTIFLAVNFIANSFIYSSFATNDQKTAQELKQEIEQKSQALKELEKQAKVFKTNLKSTQVLSSSLKNEIRRLDNTENSLNYSIKITQEKLNIVSLELEKLTLEISSTEEKIKQSKEKISNLLQTLYEKDQDTFLEIALSGKNLSDLFNEVQIILGLENQLNENLEEMEVNKKEMEEKKEELERMESEQKLLKQNLQARSNILANEKQSKKNILLKTKNKESNYRKLLAQIENRHQQIAKEIDDLEESLRKKINIADLPKDKVLSWPAKGPITQGYGATRFARTHYHSRFHNGIDIGLPIGTPLKAAASGIVISTGNEDRYCYRGAYGKYILIKHYNGLATLCAHLSLIKVKTGQKVKRGQIIGYSGRSGYATGPHLHFGVYDAKTVVVKQSRYCGPMPFGGSVNPLKYLP